MSKRNIGLLGILFTSIQLMAQNPIPNAGFNAWNTTTYEVPNQWMMIGSTNKTISKTTVNLNGFELKNDVMNNVISQAMNVGAGYPDKLTGGFAITGTPASIKINYNSANLGNDTALVIVGFTKELDPIPMILQEFIILPDGTGAADNSITVPLTYSYPTTGVVADSGFIYFTSSQGRGKPNSTGSISIFDISFPGGQTSTNGNLNIESWGSLLVRKPDSWMTSLDVYEQRVGKMIGQQDYILSSTEARSGLSALLAQRSITTANGTELIPAWMVTKDTSLGYADMGTPSFKVNQRYNSIRGYWKGTLNTGDRATVMINFFHADTLVGSGMFSQDNKTTVPGNYMMFAENIVWAPGFTLTPTKATIGAFLTDSSFQQASNVNSKIWLEDLWLDQNFAGIRTIAKTENNVVMTCFPNPSNGNIKIQSSKQIRNIYVINTAGQLIQSQLNVNENTADLDLVKPSNGGFTVYFVRIEGYDFNTTQSVIVK